MPDKLVLSPNIFIIFKDGKTILWDYKNHNQYEIDKEILNKLVSASEGNINEVKMSDLIEAEIITSPTEQITWGWDELSKIYHIGCQDIGNTTEYSSNEEWLQAYIDENKDVKLADHCLDIAGDRIDLPAHTLDNLPSEKLWDIMKKRMTSRNFNGKAIKLQELVNILYAGFGRTHKQLTEYIEKGYEETFVRKAHPSGGGLHPIECFVIVYNVEGLKSGIYYYNWDKHYLIRTKYEISIERLVKLFQNQYYTEGIACGLLLCNNNSKGWTKYEHSRCYRDLYIDLGHLQQTLLLVATQQGLLTWQTGWFRDSELSNGLGIDGYTIVPSGFIGVGKGELESIPIRKQKESVL